MFLRRMVSLLVLLTNVLAILLIVQSVHDPPSLIWIGLRLLALIHLSTLPPILYYRFRNPGITHFMRKQETLQNELFDSAIDGIIQIWVDLDDVSAEMKLAVIAGEDILFPLHYGFDWQSVQDAIVYNTATNESRRGASTITQQMVKNLFLWPQRTILRKILEAYLTLQVETWWTKRRILEVYLNLAQFDDAIFGVEAAARHKFGKPASELTMKEAALLVTVMPNPILMTVDTPDHPMRFRQVIVLESMKRLGFEYLELI